MKLHFDIFSAIGLTSLLWLAVGTAMLTADPQQLNENETEKTSASAAFQTPASGFEFTAGPDSADKGSEIIYSPEGTDLILLAGAGYGKPQGAGIELGVIYNDMVQTSFTFGYSDSWSPVPEHLKLGVYAKILFGSGSFYKFTITAEAGGDASSAPDKLTYVAGYAGLRVTLPSGLMINAGLGFLQSQKEFFEQTIEGVYYDYKKDITNSAAFKILIEIPLASFFIAHRD